MACTVKCISCNIVIDELLAYVQNKISIIDEDSLTRICVSAFKSDEIKRSKELLFESLPTEKRKIVRKRQGKENRDVEDIIVLFKGTDPEVMPVFVARALEKLPPVLFDHVDVTKLLKDLLILQTEISDIKSKYVTSEQLNEVRTEMRNKFSTTSDSSTNQYRNIRINTRRGACLDSGPMGLSPHLDTTIIDRLDGTSNLSNKNNDCTPRNYLHQTSQANIVDTAIVSAVYTAPDLRDVRGSLQSKEAVQSDIICANLEPTGVCVTADYCQNKSPRLGPPVVRAKRQLFDMSTINTNKSRCEEMVEHSDNKISVEKRQDTEGEWKVVQKRKPRRNYRYLGTAGSAQDKEERFKAAETKIPIFITKVHIETSEQDITEYVYKKTHERISLEKIAFRREKDHKAYKFLVSEQKLSLFLDEKLWPQGIIFRRFVHYKPRKYVNSVSDTVCGQKKYNA